MSVRRKLLASTALMAALSSCVAPVTSPAPAGTPVATAPPGTPAPASVKPAPAPELPAAPPISNDARLRLTGVVLFNDTPVTDASLTAVDVATGKAIVLTPWSDVPTGLKLLSTHKTDAKGAFDLALGHPWPLQDQSIPGQPLEFPKLNEGQVVKLVATKGNQTFTALFNNRGQAIGADTPTTASYQLQQGTAVTVTIRLRLSPATTAATQAFEGALKLTFQLPEVASAERQAAVLEAARKAAQEVEEALDKSPLSAIPGLRGISPSLDKSPLSAIPGLRGISPSLDKSDAAARLVGAVNSAGETSQLENFRTAVTNLGVFDSLFKAVQAELLALAAQTLVAREGLAPIVARDFPLDRVVISPSGLLGFSGQRNPIKLGGVVTSHFVPSSPGGSGGGPPPAPPPGLDSLRSWGGINSALGVGFYGNRVDIPPGLRDAILVTDTASSSTRLFRLSARGDSEPVSFALPGVTAYLVGVAAVDDSTTTILVSVDNWGGLQQPCVARFAWDNSLATYTLEASGAVGLRAAGGVVSGGRFWQLSNASGNPGDGFIRSWPLTGDLDDAASQTMAVGGSPLQLSSIPGNEAPRGAWNLAVDANGTATRVYWMSRSGRLLRYSDDGTTAAATVIATIANGDTYGAVALAPDGNRLYVSTDGTAYYVDYPASGATVAPQAFASIPADPTVSPQFRGGALSRPGSVVFTVLNSLVPSVIRLPTPQ